MALGGLIDRLDERVAEAPLLTHPFYQAWSAGRLSLEDLSLYATQYWRQVEAFPGYLQALAARLEDGPARNAIVSNLRDELEDDHAGLWMRFADAVGAERATLDAAAPLPETSRCVGAFQEATARKSVPFALGMLYGYESQTPDVAATKVEGLDRHYGISGEAVHYFKLHGELDVEHSTELAAAIEEVCENEADRSDAGAGAAAGAAAIWTLLDGVARTAA